ncbi:MAG TPA: hypothetical protein VLV46_11815 [Gaiellaceae bacterium]|nr:hypothetical protein [Gaiellaceae bacterium]
MGRHHGKLKLALTTALTMTATLALASVASAAEVNDQAPVGRRLPPPVSPSDLDWRGAAIITASVVLVILVSLLLVSNGRSRAELATSE